MKVYKWTPPTTNYPDLINIKPVKHSSNINYYKYIYALLVIISIIIIILSYYNGS
jgi:hypothetical protein